MDRLVQLAKRVTEATGCPVVGGMATMLHGGGLFASDIDIYSTDRWATHERLESAGFIWHADSREHLIDATPIHMVPESLLGGPPEHFIAIEGVAVISLADLIRIKLSIGLERIGHAKHIAHVLDLIQHRNLRADFGKRLPTRLRPAFLKLVNVVHAPRRSSISPFEFWKEYGTCAAA